MNIFTKALLGSTLALGSIFGSVAPAEAGTCWFKDYNRGDLAPTYCYTDTRINANGHRVFDVIDHGGNEFTLVFWTDKVVEIIGIEPRPIQAQWWTDRQGDTRIAVGDFEMAIRF